MFLEKISNFLVKNRKKIIFYSIFVLFIFIVLHDSSFAADAASNTQTTSDAGATNSDTNKRLNIWNRVVGGIASVLGVFTYLVTLLLDPDFISGKLFGINGKLHDLWILISNIVYFVFAFILIWIAFMNIIGKNDNKWELKQALPKFVVGVLIVPFSWFFVSLVVSLASVLTMAALALPADTFPDYKTKMNEIDIPKHCTLNLQSESKTDKGWFYCDEGDNWKLGELTQDSVFGLVSSYTYGLLKVDSLSKTSKSQIGTAIKTLEDLIIYLLFSGIFILVYFILMMALAIVLLVRVIWLWIYMALSPLFGLAYFFGKDSNAEIFKKINITEFVGVAMVPVYTTLALSFGFLFLSLTMTGLEGVSTQDNGSKTESVEGNNYILDKDGITIKFGTTDEPKDVRLDVEGGGAFSQLIGGVSQYKGDIFDSTFGFVGAIFMNVFGVVVFWVAIMAALQSSNITKEVVAPLKQFGESVGSLASKAPTYAPIFPGGQSMQSMNKAIASIQGSFETGASNRASKFLKNTPFGETAGVQAKLQKIINENEAGVGGPDALVSRIRETMKLADGNINKLFTEKEYQEALYSSFKRALSEAELKKLGVTKASDIKDKATLTKILSAIDKKGQYSGLYEGKDLGSGDIRDVEKLVQDLAKGKVNTSPSQTQQTKQNINIKFNNGAQLTNDLIKKGSDNKIDIDKTATEIAAQLSKDQDVSKEEFINGLAKKLKEQLSLETGQAENIADAIANSKKITFKENN